jgi:hypothetical protein
MIGVETHVFSPLCVAQPLAKNRASIYGIPPPAYIITDPMRVIAMMYVSGAQLALPCLAFAISTYNEGL